MLRAVGLEEDDFALPQVGLVSAGNEVTPCNLTGPMLAAEAKRGFAPKAVSGSPSPPSPSPTGSPWGTRACASLVSREVIADSVELVMHAERFDALVAIAGCDKSLPGMLMAAARLNLPAVFLYGGSSLPAGLGTGTSRWWTSSRGSAPSPRAGSARAICSTWSATPVPAPGRAPGCSPPTRWLRLVRHWGCRSPGAPACRRSTEAGCVCRCLGRGGHGLARARPGPAPSSPGRRSRTQSRR